MTRAEAAQLAELVTGLAAPSPNGDGIDRARDALAVAFPRFGWRVILDRSGHYARWAITIDPRDKREHYVSRSTGRCVCCGKSAKQLRVPERDDGDD